MARSSKQAREQLIAKVQAALGLVTKKDGERAVSIFINCLEETLLGHLTEDEFSLKLNGFGKFKVHHKPPVHRRIGFSGETTITKPRRVVRFVSLGRLRQCEAWEGARESAR